LVGGGSIIAGKEIVMLNLARGLRGAGYRTAFITSRWGGKDEFVSRLNKDGFEYYRVRLGFISKTLSWKPLIWTTTQLLYWPALVAGYLHAIWALAPRVVIHTNWHHALLLMPFLNRHRDLYWSHETVLDSSHYRWIFRSIARRVARVICVSHAVADSMRRAGIPATKLIVIHNGIAPDTTVAPPRAQLPLRLGIVGQIGAWKGHEDAVDALARLPSGAAILKIFGAGQSEYVRMLKQKAQDLRVTDLIEWCGFVTNKRDIYRAVDVCLMPSRVEESFGMAALEAGSFGRPVICSARGALTEIVEDHRTGLVVDSGRPERLADAIESLCQDPPSVVRMGDEARRHVEAKFSETLFVRRFSDLIDEVGDAGSGIKGRTD
jgi:glycosyltransferase involved in cell wall biosynthesis